MAFLGQTLRIFLKNFSEPGNLTKFFTHFCVKLTFLPIFAKKQFFILFKTLRIFLKIFSEPGNLTKFFTHFCVKLTFLPTFAKNTYCCYDCKGSLKLTNS